MDTVIRVQILGGAVCISHRASTFQKGMNPTILLLAMNIKLDKMGSLILVWQSIYEKENAEVNSAC